MQEYGAEVTRFGPLSDLTAHRGDSERLLPSTAQLQAVSIRCRRGRPLRNGVGVEYGTLGHDQRSSPTDVDRGEDCWYPAFHRRERPVDLRGLAFSKFFPPFSLEVGTSW